MTIASVFFNTYGRLRSGWRFLIFILGFVFFLIPVSLGVHTALGKLPIGYGPDGMLFKMVDRCVSLLIALGMGWICGRILEGLPIRALGASFTKGWFKNLSLGSVIGTLSFLLAVLIAMLFGGLSFKINPDYGNMAILLTLGISLLFFAVAAAFEEALCRGYILQTFMRAGFVWPAIIGTSILFGAGHLRNPNASWISVANTVLAGVWFGVAYMKTRTLWLPFGMHFIWNWVQGSIFGIEVSGLTDILKAPLLQEIDRGPTWLTGGDYGIEASIACTIALILSTIAIYFLPILKPADEMLDLTSHERPSSS